jgi:anti-sigma factor RsiW
MTCREIVELMTGYVEGTLTSADRTSFEEHIAGCDGCRAYLAQLQTTKKALGALAEESVPEGLKGQLLEAFRNWKSA